jgi:hypothetical protein
MSFNVSFLIAKGRKMMFELDPTTTERPDCGKSKKHIGHGEKLVRTEEKGRRGPVREFSHYGCVEGTHKPGEDGVWRPVKKL